MRSLCWPDTPTNHYHTLDDVYDDIEYTGLTDHVQTFYDTMNA
jgi:hypothetical protein